MSASTIYDITLRYLMEDKASKGVDRLGGSLHKASLSSRLLQSNLGQAAVTAASSFGFRGAAKALIGFNSNMEQVRTTTAGLLQLNLGGEFTDRLGQASGIVKELQERAAKSTATTAEFAGFMSEIVQPVTAAGLAVKDLAGFTAKSVVAAKAFGDESIAAMDIQQALTKGVAQRDRFTMKLLNSVKMTREEFNKMGTAARLATLQRALGGDAISNLANAQAGTFEGVFSTLKDNMEMVMGQIGKPLFEAITAEIKGWGTWLGNNQDKVREFAAEVGSSLKGAFNVLKSVGSFLARNRDTIVLLAKAALAFKATRSIAGMVTGPMASIMAMSEAAKKGETGLASFAGKANLVTMGLGALAAGLAMMVDLIHREHEEGLKRRGEAGVNQLTLDQAKALGGTQLDLMNAGHKLGLSSRQARDKFSRDIFDSGGGKGLVKGGKVSTSGREQLIQTLTGMQKMGGAAETARVKLAEELGLARIEAGLERAAARHADLIRREIDVGAQKFNEALMDGSTFFAKELEAASGMFPGLGGDPFIGPTGEGFAPDPGGAPAKTKITVNRVDIQVESNDPDRFVFNLESTLRKLAKNPAAASGSGRLG